jgi:hypothetical protein
MKFSKNELNDNYKINYWMNKLDECGNINCGKIITSKQIKKRGY